MISDYSVVSVERVVYNDDTTGYLLLISNQRARPPNTIDIRTIRVESPEIIHNAEAQEQKRLRR